IPDMPDMPSCFCGLCALLAFLPSMPDIPSIPDIPPMPDIPFWPSMPDIPDIPFWPSIPDIPDIPFCSARAEVAAARETIAIAAIVDSLFIYILSNFLVCASTVRAETVPVTTGAPYMSTSHANQSGTHKPLIFIENKNNAKIQPPRQPAKMAAGIHDQ